MGILNFQFQRDIQPSSYGWVFLASQLGETFWGEDGAIDLRYQTLTVTEQPEVGVGGGRFRFGDFGWGFPGKKNVNINDPWWMRVNE